MWSSCCEHVARPTSLLNGVVLRIMKASDLPQVRALHRKLLPVSYPAAFFIQLLVNPRQLCLVATDHDTVVGFASAMSLGSAGEYLRNGRADQKNSEESCSDIPRAQVTLLTLGVLPAYQRRGIGRSLVQGVVQRLQSYTCGGALDQAYDPASQSGLGSDHVRDHQDGKIAIFVQADVAPSNHAGKCFYTHMGMMDQRSSVDQRLRLGLGSRTSVMAGLMHV